MLVRMLRVCVGATICTPIFKASRLGFPYPFKASNLRASRILRAIGSGFCGALVASVGYLLGWAGLVGLLGLYDNRTHAGN